MKKILFFILLNLFPALTFAQGEEAQGGLVPCEIGQCTICHFFQLIQNVISLFLFTIVPILIPLMIALGGLFMVLGYIVPEKGPENIKKAKSIFKGVIIGTVLIYTAWIIVNLFFQVIGVITWDGFDATGWWSFECPVD